MKKVYKKIIMAAMAAVMMLGAIPVSASEDAALDTVQMSEEEIRQAASDLLNDLLEYSVSDTEKFTSLWMGTSDEDIQYFQDFLSGVYNEHYSKQIVRVVLSQDPYYQIATCCYTVAGTHPNTNMSNHTFNFIMSLTEEGWKVNNSDAAISALDTPENYLLMYPESVMEAVNAGRNAQSFGYAFLLDETTVFEGDFDVSLAYLYQNEDGSADALFWMANGTSGAIYVNQISLTVTDDSLGTVLDQTVSTGEMVNAGYSKMVQLHFEPSQILTGTQPWTTMYYDCSTSF